MNKLIETLAAFSAQQASMALQGVVSPPPHLPAPVIDANSLATAIVQTMQSDGEKMKEKACRAVLVGVPEAMSPEQTTKADEKLLGELIEWTGDELLKELYDNAQIQHGRHPKNAPPRKRILKVLFPDASLRDRFLSLVRSKGRNVPLEKFVGAYVRKDLMPMELKLEKEAKAEARRRNVEEGFLRYGVRDTALREFRRPWRELPQPYSRPDPDPLGLSPLSPLPRPPLQPSRFSPPRLPPPLSVPRRTVARSLLVHRLHSLFPFVLTL